MGPTEGKFRAGDEMDNLYALDPDFLKLVNYKSNTLPKILKSEFDCRGERLGKGFFLLGNELISEGNALGLYLAVE